jgi:hypothetical protein
VALAWGNNIDPANYYMRTHAILETGDPDLSWINRTLVVGTGARLADQVIMTLFVIRQIIGSNTASSVSNLMQNLYPFEPSLLR